MGNTFAKDNDTIHWKSLKTENISDNKKYNFMSEDSKQLLEKLELNLPKLSENTDLTSDLSVFSKNEATISTVMKPLVGGGLDTETRETVNNSLSSSSPFISSEVYNLLMKKGSVQKGGRIEGDDSSTSSTSSSDDLDSSSDNLDDSSSEEIKKKKKSKAKGKKNLKGGKKIVSESSEANELSYISSSAHSDNLNSESDASALLKSETELNGGYQSSSDNYVSSSKSNETTEYTNRMTENSTIQNLNNSLPDSSIRTSDIHMITE